MSLAPHNWHKHGLVIPAELCLMVACALCVSD